KGLLICSSIEKQNFKIKEKSDVDFDKEELDRSKVVESDDEQEFLFSIPFNGVVKITGLCVIGENGPTHPNTVK
ncbi:unnamed protein product, partial [Rotaria sp. Silwood2]